MRLLVLLLIIYFFFNDPAPTEIYTLSLHDALPICARPGMCRVLARAGVVEAGARVDGPARPPHARAPGTGLRSEEHTSELQSRQYLVCRLLLEKKKKK